jgi:sugar/nucleoside kinase (ribokinase family)
VSAPAERHAVCVVGHVTRDRLRRGARVRLSPGGVACYASAAYAALGLEPLVVTKAARADRAILRALARNGARIRCAKSRVTTRFENAQSTDLAEREQRVLGVAAPFTPADLADVRARFMHLGPLLPQDMSLAFLRAAALSAERVVLDVQGFTRRLAGKAVLSSGWRYKRQGLALVAVLKADAREAYHLTGESDPGLAARTLAKLGPEEVLVTLGAQGALVLVRGRLHHVPASRPRRLVDTTGAGDTFLAGYVAARLADEVPKEAARFAASLAAEKIERFGALSSTRLRRAPRRPSRRRYTS